MDRIVLSREIAGPQSLLDFDARLLWYMNIQQTQGCVWSAKYFCSTAQLAMVSRLSHHFLSSKHLNRGLLRNRCFSIALRTYSTNPRIHDARAIWLLSR